MQHKITVQENASSFTVRCTCGRYVVMVSVNDALAALREVHASDGVS